MIQALRWVQKPLFGKTALAALVALGAVMAAQAAFQDLDPTFGTDGVVTNDMGSPNDSGNGVAIDSTNRIYQLGYRFDQAPNSPRTNTFYVVRRFLPGNGAGDGSFANVGNLVIPHDGSNAVEFFGLALDDARGFLYLLGSRGSQTTGIGGVLVERYTLAGVKDTTWGDSANLNRAIFDTGAATSATKGVVQLDGKLLLTGGDTQSAIVARLTTTGTLDSSFGTNGIARLGTAADTRGEALALDTSGQIYVVDNRASFVCRLSSSGVLSTGFGTSGCFTDASAPSGGGGAAITPQADGTVLAVIAFTDFSANPFAQVIQYLKLSSSGAPVAGFGTNGRLSSDFNGPSNFGIRRMVVQSDGKPVISGTLTAINANNAGLIRLEGNPKDTSPDTFSFTDQTGKACNINADSNEITVTGIDAPTPISITVGKYRIGTGAFVDTSGTVSNNDKVTVRIRTGNTPNREQTATLTIGDKSAAFKVANTAVDCIAGSTLEPAADDTTPDQFVFNDKSDVLGGTLITSDAVTIVGINKPAKIKVQNGLYRIGAGGSFVNTEGLVNAGDQVSVQHTASAVDGQAVDTVLTIGHEPATATTPAKAGVRDIFTSTTLAPVDVNPDPFTFVDQNDVMTGSEQTSNAVKIIGLAKDVSAQISVAGVSGSTYSIGTGAFVTTVGMVKNGDTVRVRHNAAPAADTAVNTTLRVGGVSDTFSSITAASPIAIPGATPADTTPAPFRFTDQVDVRQGSPKTSNEITVSGITSSAPISITGGEYSINEEPFTNLPGSVSNGARVRVRHIAARAPDRETDTVLSVGSFSDTFSSVTAKLASMKNNATLADARAETVKIATTLGNLANVQRVTQPAQAPSSFAYRNGFFGFSIEGVPEGSTATVAMDLPLGSVPDAFVKCFQSATGTICSQYSGATLNGSNRVLLTLTDGGDGDADGIANGVIIDPGAPAYLPTNTSGGATGSATGSTTGGTTGGTTAGGGTGTTTGGTAPSGNINDALGGTTAGGTVSPPSSAPASDNGGALGWMLLLPLLLPALRRRLV